MAWNDDLDRESVWIAKGAKASAKDAKGSVVGKVEWAYRRLAAQ